ILARMYLERVQRILYGLDIYQDAALSGKNPSNYNALAETDKAIEHVYKSSPDTTFRQGNPVEWSWFVVKNITPRYALFFKAGLLESVGKNEEALKALNDADVYVDRNESWDSFVCHYYP